MAHPAARGRCPAGDEPDRGLLAARRFEELRGILRQEGVTYRVTKNTLLRLATAGNSALADVDPKTFSGPMALAMGFEDEVAPARLIFQYAKKHDALEIVGALTGDGQILTPAQVKALARSKVPVIAYVSCEAASFARDAALLAAGGYRIGPVTPVDQFLWSSHIELAGRFTRS